MTQPVAIITGSCGLVGSAAVRYFAKREFRIVGIDNDMRGALFGQEASTRSIRDQMIGAGISYHHYDADIRDTSSVNDVFKLWSDFDSETHLAAVIHCAAQPSHDWAARDPQADFGINAVGTLNLLEAARRHCPKAAFIFMSTNKVYGDWVNNAEMVEGESRYEAVVPQLTGYDGIKNAWFNGVDERIPIDQSKHSIFGCSKLAADVLVQEYGRYFGMKTVCFRAGCITGPAHAGAKLHGFLSYLVRCAMTGETYQIIGYKGKQVRDNIHATDLAAAFGEYVKAPRPGEVYNIGGGRERSCSVREAIDLVQRISGKNIDTEYVDEPRSGDHIWWISDTTKFERDYPAWKQRYSLEETVREIVNAHA